MQDEESKLFARDFDHNKSFWAMTPQEVFGFVRSAELGLTEKDAVQRLAKWGRNSIPDKRRLAKTLIVARQFKNPLIAILVVAGIVMIFLGERINATVIVAAVVVNTALGFYQENKAEQVLHILKSYVRARTRVRRDNNEREIDAEELVVGDMVRLSAGDRVPADGRIVYANNCFIDESVLTGESLPVEKQSDAVSARAGLAERTSMVFNGTLVSEGFADVIVTSTGAFTEFGKIALLVERTQPEQTPLQRVISLFSLRAGVVLGILVFIMFVAGLAVGYKLFDMFLISVAVAVSAVPEGLPVALTVILAVGVERLARRNGVVRKLLAAETLGSTTLILTDKTGTLTGASMQMKDIVLMSQTDSEDEKTLLRDALINTDVVVENISDEPSKWRTVGRPIEVALIRGAAVRGVTRQDAMLNTTILDRLPFNSLNKFSISVIQRGARTRLVVVGAPDIVLRFVSPHDHEITKISAEIKQRAFAGERLIGVASKELVGDFSATIKKIAKSSGVKNHIQHLSGLEFRGIIAFRDPLRPFAKNALERIAKAGVKTVIVTGDHEGTALSVAKELGIAENENDILRGEGMEHMSEAELITKIKHIRVFARVSPEQKLMLARLYQTQGEIVAMTGDGINDAPALAAADIGIAPGSGTDVAKSQADLIILDNNFETIVAAIEEGRTIILNIRKVIVYLLSNSLDELLLIGGSLLVGISLPINALQILFVNFFSDSFPAVAFAFENNAHGLAKKPNKPMSIFDNTTRFLVFVVGVVTSAMLFGIYYTMTMLELPEDTTKTFIFGAFSTYTLFLVFSLKNIEQNIWHYNPFTNRYLLLGAGIGFAMVGSAIYIRPLGAILGTVYLPPLWLFGIVGVGLVNIAFVEVCKWFLKKSL